MTNQPGRRDGRPPGATLLRLYPADWRRRYEAEMLAILEDIQLSPRSRFDLVRGGLDARLHAPTRLPAGAAFLAGGLWTFAGAGIIAQPAPPDWPGYLSESLPVAIVAVGAGAVATVGCWARGSDRAGRFGSVAAGLALASHVIWAAALVAALVGLGYGSITAAAQGLGVLGPVLVGLALLRGSDGGLGALLVTGSALMLFAWPIAWLGFGLAWTAAGVLLAIGLDPDTPRLSRTG